MDVDDLASVHNMKDNYKVLNWNIFTTKLLYHHIYNKNQTEDSANGNETLWTNKNPLEFKGLVHLKYDAVQA